MELDEIEVDGMEFFGYHGCLPEERANGQNFLVDVRLGLDIAAAAAKDDLNLTVNYAAVQEKIAAIVQGKPYRLLETLAEKIAGMVLTEFPLVRKIKVTVHKPQAPLPGKFADVAVTVRRQRNDN